VEGLEDRSVPTFGFGDLLQFDGNATESISDVIVDRFGFTTVTGTFTGTIDMDLSEGVTPLASVGGSQDAFVAQYDPAGRLMWARSIGTVNVEQGIAVAADDSGNVFVVTDEQASGGAYFISVRRLDGAGDQQWIRQVTSTGSVRARDLDLGANTLFVTGAFSGTADFNPFSAIDNRNPTGSQDGFLWALLTDGGYVGTDTSGAGGSDTGTGVSASPGGFGAAWVFETDLGSHSNVSVRRVEGSLTVAYTRSLNSANTERSAIPALDRFGNVMVIGEFNGTSDFDPGAGVFNLASFGGYDVFLWGLDAAGNLDFALHYGGGFDDIAADIKADFAGDVWLAWREAQNGTGSARALVQKTDPNSLSTVLFDETSTNGNVLPTSLAIDPRGGVRVGAMLSGADDFDLYSAAGSASAADGLDFVVWRLHERPDALGRANNGQWWLATNERTNFTTVLDGGWNEAAGWRDVLRGEFDGDGLQDIVGRTASGEWWVARGGGVPLANTFFGQWNEAANWRDVRAADFNGDGLTDVIGRTATGQWWLGVSNGVAFETSFVGAWNEGANWRDVVVGDFQDDDRPDVAGRTSSGQWWVLRNDGSGFVGSDFWVGWNEAAGWRDIRVGDFTGDGRDDILGRTSSGQWWAAVSNGNAFANQFIGAWNELANWRDVLVGDFNGDGFLDVAGRTQIGQWWVGTGDGAALTFSFWTAWSNAVNWRDVTAGDFDGDGLVDIIGRSTQGEWWVATSNGDSFTSNFWGTWNEAAQWRDVRFGDLYGNG
jgi:hypothetical protein